MRPDMRREIYQYVGRAREGVEGRMGGVEMKGKRNGIEREMEGEGREGEGREC
jgi:hypothetical protein